MLWTNAAAEALTLARGTEWIPVSSKELFGQSSRSSGVVVTSITGDNGSLQRFSTQINSELCVVRPYPAAELILNSIYTGIKGNPSTKQI
jgi:hypothetical protein